MSTKKINVAIVGLGFGKEFIPIYQCHPDAEMYAICQRTQQKLDEVGDQYGVARRYASFAELIADPDVDAVHINSPIHLHAPQSIAALKAGAAVVPERTPVGQLDLCGHLRTRVCHAGRRDGQVAGIRIGMLL
jgi:predicted dehydrogenase